MNDFKHYWEEKSQKLRKTWEAKSKRYAKHHTELEDIRKEVFLPIDYTPGFDLSEYKVLHFIKHNPFVKWQQGQFEFSENDLREVMIAQGADMATFKMIVNQDSIVGKEPPQPKVIRYLEITPNKVFDIERHYIVEHPEYDGMIIITDGYAPVPEIPPLCKAKLLWIIDNEASFRQNSKALRKTGRVCLMQV